MEAVLTRTQQTATTHGRIIQEEPEEPRFSRRTLAAMEEALRIMDDPDYPSYDSMEELKKALEA